MPTPRALLEPQSDGETWRFGGPEALTYDETAAILSDALGRPVTHARVDVPNVQEPAASRGLPAHVIDTIIEARASRPMARSSPPMRTFRRILGRPASPLRDWVDRHRAALAV